MTHKKQYMIAVSEEVHKELNDLRKQYKLKSVDAVLKVNGGYGQKEVYELKTEVKQ